MASDTPAFSTPPTWTDLAALPSHLLGLTAGILGGAGHTMAVLVAIHTGAQDAGHGAEGEHSRVPHLPVGVCLPVVGAGWNMESREEAGRVSASGWPRVSSPKSRGCQEHTSCIACKMLAREQNLYQPCIPQEPSPGLRGSSGGERRMLVWQSENRRAEDNSHTRWRVL